MPDPTRQSPVLEIEGLSVALPKSADRRFAVETLSLSVGAGEIVCVVGESGSGKSVTAHSVMGLLPKGQLHFFLWNARPSSAKAQRELGWVPTPLEEGLRAVVAAFG